MLAKPHVTFLYRLYGANHGDHRAFAVVRAGIDEEALGERDKSNGEDVGLVEQPAEGLHIDAKSVIGKHGCPPPPPVVLKTKGWC